MATSTTAANQTSCLKWFIYSIDEKGTASESDDVVNMILDHNTSLGSWHSQEKNQFGPTVAVVQIATDTSGWSSNKLISPSDYTATWIRSNIEYTYTVTYTTNARLIEADEVARIKGERSWTYASICIHHCEDGQSLMPLQSLPSFLYTNLNTDSGVRNTGYWTSSPNILSNGSVIIVGRSGMLSSNPANFDYFEGLRPVISVLKSDIF